MIDQILSETARLVEQRKSERSLNFLKQKVSATSRSLAFALKKNRSTVILECKKASPSQGVIRKDFSVAEIIKAYDPIADVISVITNAPFFEGDLAYLRMAREFTQKPLLCKDFILSPYQVYEARYFDADAVLLMMSVLDDPTFSECFEVATSLNMDVLVEVHDELELARALKLGAKIIGVNNRDFRTLEVDLKTAERLLPLIPEGIVKVFESGVSKHQEILANQKIAHAFLIGTSLMRRPDLKRAVRELVFGRVKVCGLTRNEDANEAFKAGATFGGLIFAAESPRCITKIQAKDIMLGCELDFVGVFVNEKIETIVEHVKDLGLCAVQLHGEETALDVSNLRAHLPSTCEIWKAIRVQERIPTPADFNCDRIVLDAYQKNLRGGTGHSFAWDILHNLPSSDFYILSGGLSPDNASLAQTHGLWALDVNSGVETSPGLKDINMVNAFLEELR